MPKTLWDKNPHREKEIIFIAFFAVRYDRIRLAVFLRRVL
jgi:hypothetical protein